MLAAPAAAAAVAAVAARCGVDWGGAHTWRAYASSYVHTPNMLRCPQPSSRFRQEKKNKAESELRVTTDDVERIVVQKQGSSTAPLKASLDRLNDRMSNKAEYTDLKKCVLPQQHVKPQCLAIHAGVRWARRAADPCSALCRMLASTTQAAARASLSAQARQAGRAGRSGGPAGPNAG